MPDGFIILDHRPEPEDDRPAPTLGIDFWPEEVPLDSAPPALPLDACQPTEAPDEAQSQDDRQAHRKAAKRVVFDTENLSDALAELDEGVESNGGAWLTRGEARALRAEYLRLKRAAGEGLRP